MSRRVKRVIKAVLFGLLAVGIFLLCSFIVQPIWSTSNYNPVYGFYEEPEDTIETLFVGSSHIRRGISPMQLYEDYGICAYDLSTDAQPVLASYYWIEEVYRLHADTLDTVVLDVSTLRRELSTVYCHKALDPMKFSAVKLRAVKAYSEDFTDFTYNLFSVFSYHDRWKELSDEDFQKFALEPAVYLRGYSYTTSSWIKEASDFSEISTPVRVLDEEAGETPLSETALTYFDKTVSFCREHGICLVLIKTPTDWSSADHNAVQALADRYGLDFLDFNVDPYYSEIEFCLAADVMDPTDVTNLHLNYDGAVKLTDYMGRYLIEACGNRDVRGDEKYAFLEEELADYRRLVTLDQSRLYAADPCDYLRAALDAGDCSIFISVKDDAAASLTAEQRSYFASIGLTQLADLTVHDSYLAVIEDGTVITEQVQADPGADGKNDDLLTYTGKLPDKTAYTIISGGFYMGNCSSILIDGTERSANQRGLNIAIYDNHLKRYAGNANFDTYAAAERQVAFCARDYEELMEAGTSPSALTGKSRMLYLYNRECENEKTAKLARQQKDEDDGLLTYLQAFWDDEDIDILIMTQGDASAVLTDDLRDDLSQMGLSSLSQLKSGEGYAAVAEGKEITEEVFSAASVSGQLSSSRYSLKSTGTGQADAAAVTIKGTEYAAEEDGIFVVIYDAITDMVVDRITFTPYAADSDEDGEAAA